MKRLYIHPKVDIVKIMEEMSLLQGSNEHEGPDGMKEETTPPEYDPNDPPLQ